MGKRLLKEKDYNEAIDVINSLVETIQKKSLSWRMKSLFLAELTEMRFRFEHHLLGDKCKSLNLDHLEIRDQDIAALMENKVEGMKLSDYEKGYHMSLANKAGIPYFIVIHNLNDRSKKIVIPLGVQKTFSMFWDEYKKFMENLPNSIYKLCNSFHKT